MPDRIGCGGREVYPSADASAAPTPEVPAAARHKVLTSATACSMAGFGVGVGGRMASEVQKGLPATVDPGAGRTQVSASDDGGGDIDLLGLAAVIWAGKWRVALCVTVAFCVGAFLYLRAQPMYQAAGLLQLEQRAGTLALPEGMQELIGDGGGDSAVEAEIEIMRSRMVMREAVETLDLQVFAWPRPLPVLGLIPWRLKLPDPGFAFIRRYQWGNEAIVVGELEVPDGWLNADIPLTAVAPGSYVVSLPDGSSRTGRVGERLADADAGLSLVVDRLEGPAGREFVIGRKSLPRAVASLQESFSVATAGRGTPILRVTFTATDPRRAMAVLDAIADAYVSQNVARGAIEAQKSLDFIEEQLPIAETEVQQAQQALNAYRQQQQSVDVEYETRILLDRATAIEAELGALALREEDVQRRYTVNHPVYQALLANRAALQKELDGIRASTGALPETQKEIFNLSRDLEVAQQVYVQLLNRAQELRVVRASAVGSVRVVDTAYADPRPVSPRRNRMLALAIVLGGMAGVGWVLLRQALRRGVRGAQEIEQAGLPVFATVSFSTDVANLRRTKAGDLPILAQVKPDDVVVEALRALRTSLHFGMLDAKAKSLLLTSAAPGAGKSFTAVNLATVAAQAGQKVCLLDADLRRGYQRRFFSKPKGTPGLAEVIAREKTLDEVLVQGAMPGLQAVLTGRYPPNPSELLMRAEFEALLAELDSRFDLVIIDAPPVLAVTDPVIISRYTGATILVVRHMETMMGEIEAVRRTFETAGTKLTGAILNGFKAEAGSAYGRQYYYYNYRYSYKSDR